MSMGSICDKCGKEIKSNEIYHHPSGVHRDDFCKECYEKITGPSGRGGAREGAGRPSQGETKKVSITLTEELWDYVEMRGDKYAQYGSKSAFIRYLIEKNHEEWKKAIESPSK